MTTITTDNFKKVEAIKAIYRSFGIYKDIEIDDYVLDLNDNFKSYIINTTGKTKKVECLVFIDDTIIIPLKLNDINADSDADAIKKVKDKSYGYTYAQDDIFDGDSFVFDIEVPVDAEVVECYETELKIYEKLSAKGELFSTPYDEDGDIEHFINHIAFDAYCGQYYSKDFGYFFCDSCGRYICEQNSSNGYMTQYQYYCYEMVCNACYEKEKLTQGMFEDEFENTMPGLFTSNAELIENGWTEGDTIFVNNANKNETLERMRKITEDKKLFIQLDRLSIMGNEGTFTYWTKEK